MGGRVLIGLSLALNVALAFLLLRAKQPAAPPAPAEIASVEESTNAAPSSKTNVVVRRQFFHWNEIESDDYTVFIANLRRIGCPELTVRDIIIADVNQMFAQRRAQEIVTAESQWWRTEPDLDATEAALAQMSKLEEDRVALLTRLLGPNWNVNFTSPSERGTVALNGPVLGRLEPDVKRRVQELAAANSRKAQQYIEAQRAAGKTIDPIELAKLRNEHRTELAKILPPDALEEYLLRYSANSEAMRQQLRGFNATADEFRAIFRARDSIDNEIALLYGSEDPATVRARQELEKRRDAAVAAALGPDRAPLYQATSDPLFREAQFMAEQSGAPPEKVLPLYQLQVESARERDRINRDANLSASEKASQIRAVAEQEEAARKKVLGIEEEAAASAP